MGVIAGANINDNGLVFSLDAANFRSYSGSGLTSFGLVGGIGGTLVNGVGFTSANGGSFIFDGTNDFINCGNPTVLQGLQLDMTLSLWFKRLGNTGSGTLYSDYSDVSGLKIASLLRMDGSTLRYFTSSPSTTYQYVEPTNIVNNIWYFVSVTVSGTLSSPILSIFINGTTYTYNLSALINSPYTGSTHCIGGNIHVANEYFNGIISQLSIYNRALTAKEVKQNYNATKKRYGL